MAIGIARRRFIAGLGGAISWPLGARAQQPDKVYRIGYLGLASGASQVIRMNGFREGLAALGYVEGKNIIIETRWAEGQYDRLVQLAAQLVDLKVDALVTYATPGVLAAKRATTTIPIVIAAVGDAVESGLVSSLSRPGGNVTGMTFFNPELAAKRLELLKEALPSLTQVGVLFNQANPSRVQVLAAMNLAAHSLKIELSEFAIREATEFEGVFAAMAAKRVGACVITEDPIVIANAEASAKLALKYRLASGGFPEFVQAGGFVAYGVDFPEMWRHAATFVDKILKGAKPADLPVERPWKFVTIVNLKTAKILGLEIPPTLFALADEVVE